MLDQLSQLKDLLKIHWQYSEFRFGQERAIRSVLAGKNTVVVMPTGGGKSLIYQLPALILDGVTIVVSPLIALMKDQVDALERIGVPATFINSSLVPTETTQRIAAIQNNAYRLVYIAPERFYSSEFLNLLKNLKIALFAIDEAHCISEWGHDFRPSYLRLRAVVDLIGNPPVLAVTATATPEVKADIIKQLRLENPEIIVTGFDRPNLKFGVIRASDAQKCLEILEIVRHVDGSGIIYAGTRQKVESLLEYLLTSGVNATGYHAGMEIEDRKAAQNDFMDNRARIIIATNAFGLGVDKPDIRFVIHADLPGTVEAYYQEAGRAGRDGQESYCVLCYSPADRYLREFFIAGDNPPTSVIAEVYQNLLSYESDIILATYAELMEGLSEKVPDMAVGTALKILEREGYVRRNREKTGQAFLQFRHDAQHIKNRLGTGAKIQHQTFDGLCRRFGDALQKGVDVIPDEIAGIAGVKREAFTRLMKKLQNDGLAEYRPPFRGTEIVMLKRVRPQELAIDFTALKEKYKRELNKLDLMENYVYHDGCRRRYILDYFQDVKSKNCGICDNCTTTITNVGQADENPEIYSDDIKFETKLTQLQTYELYEQGLSIDEMAQARNLKPGTIVQHLCFLLAHGKNIDIAKFVDLKKQKLIQKTARQVGTDTLTPIKEALGEDVTWNEIRLVLTTKL